MRMVRYESAAWVSGALWGTMADDIEWTQTDVIYGLGRRTRPEREKPEQVLDSLGRAPVWFPFHAGSQALDSPR